MVRTPNPNKWKKKKLAKLRSCNRSAMAQTKLIEFYGSTNKSCYQHNKVETVNQLISIHSILYYSLKYGQNTFLSQIGLFVPQKGVYIISLGKS